MIHNFSNFNLNQNLKFGRQVKQHKPLEQEPIPAGPSAPVTPNVPETDPARPDDPKNGKEIVSFNDIDFKATYEVTNISDLIAKGGTLIGKVQGFAQPILNDDSITALTSEQKEQISNFAEELSKTIADYENRNIDGKLDTIIKDLKSAAETLDSVKPAINGKINLSEPVKQMEFKDGTYQHVPADQIDAFLANEERSVLQGSQIFAIKTIAEKEGVSEDQVQLVSVKATPVIVETFDDGTVNLDITLEVSYIITDESNSVTTLDNTDTVDSEEVKSLSQQQLSQEAEAAIEEFRAAFENLKETVDYNANTEGEKRQLDFPLVSSFDEVINELNTNNENGVYDNLLQEINDLIKEFTDYKSENLELKRTELNNSEPTQFNNLTKQGEYTNLNSTTKFGGAINFNNSMKFENLTKFNS